MGNGKHSKKRQSFTSKAAFKAKRLKTKRTRKYRVPTAPDYVPGPTNFSASFNETVAGSVADLKTIYAAVGAEANVSLIVSAGKQHEMDIEAVSQFLNKNFQTREDL